MSAASHHFLGATRTVVCATALVSILTLGACGFTAPRYNEGFANLDSPGMAETERTMSLSLGPTVLRFAARFLDDEPETQALLRSLDGVRVRIYEVHGAQEKVTQKLERMGHKLGDDGWSPVMLVREQDELVQMYAKESDTGLRGLTIVSADHAEVVVINIMGDIDPKHYTDVMVALNVEGAPDVQIANVN